MDTAILLASVDATDALHKRRDLWTRLWNLRGTCLQSAKEFLLSNPLTHSDDPLRAGARLTQLQLVLSATLIQGFLMSEWLSARVGFEIVRGTGWIYPVWVRADWPLGRFSIDESGVSISAGLLFCSVSVAIPWETVTDVRQTLLGMELKYKNDGEPHELAVSALFIWSRFNKCLEEHNLQIPHRSSDTTGCK